MRSRSNKATSRAPRDVGRRAFKRVESALTGERPLTTTATISRRMGRIRQRDTEAELSVRRVARELGLRYTTQNRKLPGSPDLANRSRRFAIFVHGCFWHRHVGCIRTTSPKTNRRFWTAKFRRNQQRDLEVLRELRRRGFRTIVIWECEAENSENIERSLAPFVGNDTDGR